MMSHRKIYLFLAIYLAKGLFASCGKSEETTSEANPNICSSIGPTCFVTIDKKFREVNDVYTGAPISRFKADAIDKNASDPTRSVYGIFLHDDVDLNGNVDVGDTLKLCSTARSVSSVIPNKDSVSVTFNFERDDKVQVQLFINDCVDTAKYVYSDTAGSP